MAFHDSSQGAEPESETGNAGRREGPASHSTVRPGATRLRRKLVRREGGSLCHRRISSRTLRSLSFSSAARRRFLPALFFKRFLQNVEHREVARAARRTLAPNNVFEGGHENRHLSEHHGGGAIAHTGKGSNAVYGRHEIDLQAVVFPDDAKEIRHRVVRTQDDGPHDVGNPPQFFEIARRLAKQEVEIDGRDRRPLERSRGVTDEDGFKGDFLQVTSDLLEQGRRIHAVSIPVRPGGAWIES